MRSRMPRLGSCALAVGLLMAVGCQNLDRPLLSSSATKIPYQASISFPAETLSYVYELPRQGSGPVANYSVPVGDLVRSYAQDYIDSAFDGSSGAVDVDVRIDDFRVRGYNAFVAASFEVKRGDRVVFGESYSASGSSAYTPQDWEGDQEIRQRVDLSTDQAIRAVFAKFLNAARADHSTW